MHLAVLEPGSLACSARRKHAAPGLGLQAATSGAVAVTAQVRALRHAGCFWEQACSKARRSVFGPQLGVSLGPRCSRTTAHLSTIGEVTADVGLADVVVASIGASMTPLSCSTRLAPPTSPGRQQNPCRGLDSTRLSPARLSQSSSQLAASLDVSRTCKDAGQI